MVRADNSRKGPTEQDRTGQGADNLGWAPGSGVGN